MPAPADGSGDGAHVYEYRALDGAGNASATGSCTVKIDTQGPGDRAHGLQPDNHSGWQTSGRTVTLTAGDSSGSGVAATYYTLDGGVPADVRDRLRGRRRRAAPGRSTGR